LDSFVGLLRLFTYVQGRHVQGRDTTRRCGLAAV